MDAEGNGRIREAHAAVGLQEQAGAFVARIRAVGVAAAQRERQAAGGRQTVVDHGIHVPAGLLDLDQIPVGEHEAGQHDDVAEAEDEGVRIFLRHFRGDGAGFQFLMEQMADVLVDTAHAGAVLLGVGRLHDLIEDGRLQALPVGAGRMLHDPVQAVRHPEEFGSAGLIRCLFRLGAACGRIAFAHGDSRVTDPDHRMIEHMGAGHVSEHLAAHGVQLGLSFRLDGTEALVDGRPEVCHIMALGTGADAAEIGVRGTGIQEHAVAGCVPEVIGHDALRHLGDGLVLPVVIGLTEYLAVLIAHVDGFPVLPGLAEGLVIVVDHGRDPCDAPFDVGAHAALVRSGTTHKDIVVKHVIGAVLCPVQHGTGAFEHWILVFMRLVILRIQAGALCVDGDVLAAGEHVALGADRPDAVGHGNKFKHRLITPFQRWWSQLSAVVFIIILSYSLPFYNERTI